MKNTIKVLWYIIISTIVLAMLVFTTSKVFAHGNGQCITDVAGNVFTGINNDRGYVKIVGHLTPDELDKKDGGKYKHGHIKEYWRDGEKTSESKSYTYVEDEGDFYVDCPTPPSRPVTPTPPPPRPVTPAPTTTPTTSTPDVPTPPTSTSNQETLSTTSHSAASSSSGVSEEIPRTETRETIIYSPNTVAPPPPRCEEEDKISHKFSFDAGWNLFHFSAYDPGSTVYELHNRLAHIISPKSFRLKYFNREIQDWLEFDSLQIPVGMDTHTGVMIYLEEAGDYSVHACTLENDDELILQKGWNVVGFPEPVEELSVINDFFEHSVIREVRYEIDGETFTTGRNDDRVEIPIEPWQAYMVRVKPDFTFVLMPNVSAAPMAPRRGTLATSWGGLKRIP